MKYRYDIHVQTLNQFKPFLFLKLESECYLVVYITRLQVFTKQLWGADYTSGTDHYWLISSLQLRQSSEYPHLPIPRVSGKLGPWL